MSVTIRPIIGFSGDRYVIDQIAGIAMENFSGFYGVGSLLDRKRVREDIVGNLKSYPAIQYFVALRPSQEEFHGLALKEDVLGFISWEQWGGPNRPNGDVWELKRVAVAKGHQGQGIGAQLIHQSLPVVQAHVRSQGSWLRKLILFTGSENSAQRLYQRTLHMEVVAKIPDLYRGDEVVMAVEYAKP